MSHMIITATAGQNNESLAIIQALVRALVARGIATEEEWARALEEARQEVGEARAAPIDES